MKKNSFILLILTLFCENVSAQDIKPYFTIVPDNILGYVNIGLRKDLLDLYQAGQRAEVRNLLGGTTRMTYLSPDYLSLDLSGSTGLEMRMIQEPGDSTGVIVVNKTLRTAYPESVLSFYSTNWQTLPAENCFVAPSPEAFLTREISPEERQELERAMGYNSLRMELDSAANRLRVYPEFVKSFTREDQQRWKEKIRTTPLMYVWKKGRYERE